MDSLIHWRRSQVIELLAKGKNLSQISQILKVDVSTISRDYAYIKDNSRQILQNYFSDTAPMELSQCLARLKAINTECWNVVERAITSKNDKLLLQALAEARETSQVLANVITNNKGAIDQALAFLDEREKKQVPHNTTNKGLVSNIGARSKSNISSETAESDTEATEATTEKQDERAVF